ncbi:MAG: HAD hydrolase family protein [Burkholderiales bacterium]|nr:HAD hydrolase family protein [Burkholderiales bacterium]
MTPPRLILATDLDGTFLGGSEQQRQALYRSLAADPETVLIFVTGRDLEFVRALVSQPGMPRPHYVIGDVGTTVVDGRAFEPITPLQDEIHALWGDAGDRVLRLLDGEPGLRLQPGSFPRRVSYYYDPAALRAQTVTTIEAAGFDCLLSDDTFLDVLPRGVSKGPTLRRLIDALGLPEQAVMVAGDTMNDLSLFRAGFKGVAVGNAEPRLLEAVRDFPHVYASPQPGAAGIADALRHFGLERSRP